MNRIDVDPNAFTPRDFPRVSRPLHPMPWLWEIAVIVVWLVDAVLIGRMMMSVADQLAR